MGVVFLDIGLGLFWRAHTATVWVGLGEAVNIHLAAGEIGCVKRPDNLAALTLSALPRCEQERVAALVQSPLVTAIVALFGPFAYLISRWRARGTVRSSAAPR